MNDFMPSNFCFSIEDSSHIIVYIFYIYIYFQEIYINSYKF